MLYVMYTYYKVLLHSYCELIEYLLTSMVKIIIKCDIQSQNPLLPIMTVTLHTQQVTLNGPCRAVKMNECVASRTSNQ